MEKITDVYNYQPIDDCVLIQPTPADQEKGGFALQSSEQQPKSEGTIIAVGPGIPPYNIKLNISGEATTEVLLRIESLIKLIQTTRPMKVKPGDYVLYGKYAGTKITIGSTEYIMLREKDVFCIITKEVN